MFGVNFPRLGSTGGFSLVLQVSAKEALDGKHVAFYFSSQAVEDQLEKAAQGQEAVRPTPVVKEVSFPLPGGCCHCIYNCIFVQSRVVLRGGAQHEMYTYTVCCIKYIPYVQVHVDPRRAFQLYIVVEEGSESCCRCCCRCLLWELVYSDCLPRLVADSL